MESCVTLDKAVVGSPLTLVRADGEPEMCRRLAALGLRRGAQVVVAHRTAGGGRIVQVAGARIALDRSMLARLFAEPTPAVAAVPAGELVGELVR